MDDAGDAGLVLRAPRAKVRLIGLKLTGKRGANSTALSHAQPDAQVDGIDRMQRDACQSGTFGGGNSLS